MRVHPSPGRRKKFGAKFTGEVVSALQAEEESIFRK